MHAHSNFTPERYEKCPVLFFRRRFARTCSRCSRPLRCSPPPRTTSPPATRSTRLSTIRPTIFTAQGLNNRASDISNLLDGIGNGVQVLQAANTGITSLQSLVASAQSIANQVLQSPVGYSTKSNVTSTAITGATATNLLGPRSNNTGDRHRHSGASTTTPAAPSTITARPLLSGSLHDRRQDDLVHATSPRGDTARPSNGTIASASWPARRTVRDHRHRRLSITITGAIGCLDARRHRRRHPRAPAPRAPLVIAGNAGTLTGARPDRRPRRN